MTVSQPLPAFSPERRDSFGRSAVGDALRSFRPLIEHIPVGLVFLDGARIVDANAAAARLAGFETGHMAGSPLESIAPARQPSGRASIEVLAEAARAARESGHAELRFRFGRPDSAGVDTEISLVPVAADEGALLFAVVRPADAPAARDLPHSDGNSALVGQLASGMAHSMNNLLAVIQGRLDLGRAAAEREADPRLQDNLRKAHECVARASILSRRLQALAWRDRGEPRLLSLNDLIGAVASRPAARSDARIEVVVSTAPDLVRVTADPMHVERALTGLVERAVHAMGDGGRLELGTRNLDVDDAFLAANPWAKAGRYAAVEVRDSGEPIPVHAQTSLFEPPTSDSLRRGEVSSGLHLVYAIVKNYHGYVDFESLPGRGTTFRMLLPEAIDTRESVKPVGGTSGGIDPVEGKTVLFVEDDDVVRRMVATVLRENGFRVIEARTATGAEDAFAKERETVDLLLTDILLPGGNGRDLADSFRQLRPDLRIVYTSGYASQSLPAEVAPDPRSTFVPKPFRLRDLLSAIRGLVG